MRSLFRRFLPAVLISIACASAQSQDRAEFDRRSAARYLDLFQSLDRDGDGSVTRLEAEGDLTLMPRFNDMDINRDGTVTRAELDRYLELQHGLRASGG